MRILSPLFTAIVLLASLASAAEHRVRSPDGKLACVVSDDAGLRDRVELDGKPLLADSVLGLTFADGTTLDPAAKITDTKKAARKATWDDPIGLDVPLAALGAKGRGWQLREFADGADPVALETVVEPPRDLGDTRTLTLRLSPSGGHVGTLSPKP